MACFNGAYACSGQAGNSAAIVFQITRQSVQVGGSQTSYTLGTTCRLCNSASFKQYAMKRHIAVAARNPLFTGF